MKRRNFLMAGSALALAPLVGCAKGNTPYDTFTQKLPIPALVPYTMKEGTKVFDLHVREGEVAFFKDVKTDTYGINADYLGETIRVQQGDKVQINVKNSLGELTTLHWHGLKVRGDSDGGPHSKIPAGTSWRADMVIDQHASTCWYHAHTHGQTGRQVFMGMAGLFVIDDEASSSLDIPHAYGVDDIPLIIQDRRFFSDGQLMYKQGMHDTMMGVTGDVRLVNGVIDPVIEVDPTLVRFRILNGSNARIYNLMFDGGHAFHQIASDSSLLPESVSLKNFILATGERAEIVMDFSAMAGKTVYLGDGMDKRRLLKIKVRDSEPVAKSLPKKLVKIDDYTGAKAVNKRSFTLNMSMGFLGINEKQMNMDRIDEVVKKDTFEIWEIWNPSPRPHPFHVHGTGFKILSRDGKAPLINETGLKDTVLVYPREKVQIMVVFRHEAPANRPYMYHCHILEHEDAGMMGQFTVEA